jgi:acyl transferase domain-containing protein
MLVVPLRSQRSAKHEVTDIGLDWTHAIAVVGMACRFPDSPGVDEFWELLHEGRDVIRPVSSDRWDADRHHDPVPGRRGRLTSRVGGFLDDLAAFDAGFFGISPREAARIDPAQRILLELAWESIEDAGQVPSLWPGRQVGVFVGQCYGDYEGLEMRDPTRIDIYALTGSMRSTTAGRISYHVGLEGPSLVVDTACSSSLVAVHLACQSLRSGECSLDFAGGVNVLLDPACSFAFSQAGMLSPDGRCKAFDARADGFVRSDGAGLVLLKPALAAARDGDRIRALILGSAVGNDGRSSGLLMTPSAAGQEATLRAAYRAAGVAAGDVRYVEAHGTGTTVGDAVEVDALAAVLGEGRGAAGAGQGREPRHPLRRRLLPGAAAAPAPARTHREAGDGRSPPARRSGDADPLRHAPQRSLLGVARLGQRRSGREVWRPSSSPPPSSTGERACRCPLSALACGRWLAGRRCRLSPGSRVAVQAAPTVTS